MMIIYCGRWENSDNDGEVEATRESTPGNGGNS